jgi:hypothetical protein
MLPTFSNVPRPNANNILPASVIQVVVPSIDIRSISAYPLKPLFGCSPFDRHSIDISLSTEIIWFASRRLGLEQSVMQEKAPCLRSRRVRQVLHAFPNQNAKIFISARLLTSKTFFIPTCGAAVRTDAACDLSHFGNTDHPWPSRQLSELMPRSAPRR